MSLQREESSYGKKARSESSHGTSFERGVTPYLQQRGSTFSAAIKPFDILSASMEETFSTPFISLRSGEPLGIFQLISALILESLARINQGFGR